MHALVTFWSHGVAAAAFAALLIWRLGIHYRQHGQKLLLASFALSACWAWLSAVVPGSALVSYAETARNLVWVILLYTLSAPAEQRQQGLRLVYGAVAAVVGLQLMVDLLAFTSPSEAAAQTATLLRITTAAGALVLVHNVYGQAAPASRSNIRLAMLALALIWTYDLNLYTLRYLGAATVPGLLEWRGAAVALTAPLFAVAATREEGWRIQLSRAATFQSLSLLAICAYFAVMAILATALRGSGLDWSRTLLIALLAAMTLGAAVLLPSVKARSWARVKISKHLFEHRYDYRSEWLRFTGTIGGAGDAKSPLSERVVKAFADILEAPGGLLLTPGPDGMISLAATWNWPASTPPSNDLGEPEEFWSALQASGRILELDAVRSGIAHPKDSAVALPHWMLAERCAWAGIPLIHHGRFIGLVLLAAPEYRRPLDWEDFDLLRTAGRQAASALAEALWQEALSNAQRFEEFNRRFAFILHDIKNLVSQLSLLSRNAERHAENAEFRADMVATLKSSVGKMNDLLARLSPQAQPLRLKPEPQPLRPIVSAAIAAKRGQHDVRLIGDTAVEATVDPAGLEQALRHLIQNAVEASPADSPVTVRVAARGEHICISVIDRGCGMDGDFVRNRLFQPFASTKAGGFGIGSFEARSLLAAMGGRLTVDSTPGSGTEFRILLPAAGQAAEPARKIA